MPTPCNTMTIKTSSRSQSVPKPQPPQQHHQWRHTIIAIAYHVINGLLLLWVVLLLAGCAGGRGGNTIIPVGGHYTQAQLEVKAAEVIYESVESQYPIIRTNAFEALSKLNDYYETTPMLRKGMRDDYAPVRFAACVAAGDLSATELKESLLRRLNDPSVSVRLGAGYALETMFTTEYRMNYTPVLRHNDPKLVSQACLLLGKLGTIRGREQTPDLLWRVLNEQGQSPTVRLQAAEALARMGDDRILEKLLIYAGSGYADDRVVAISGLELLGGPDATRMLTVLADDDQLEVRLAAIGALGPLAEPEHKQLVRNSLYYSKVDPADPVGVSRVRGLAVIALGKIADQDDADELYRTMSEGSEYLRLAAARATLSYLRRINQGPAM